MGSMLALLFADKAGIDVYINDVSQASMQRALHSAAEAGLASRVHACKDYEEMCQALGTSKVFVFSLPHGGPGDMVVQRLRPFLRSGDIVVDGSNENWNVTQRRQGLLQSRGVAYIGMGVSGGWAGARNGPSLMPGGERWALNRLLPLLSKVAAKDDQGRPCVAKIGSGGSGHYVKMIHNGIEHGMMSALCEAWEIMDQGLGMNGEETGEVFDSWNASGELVSYPNPMWRRPFGSHTRQRQNFLVAISGPICRRKNGEPGHYLLHDIRDTVVQDANDSEGTGVWANLEAMQAHVPVPSLSAAHYLRLASAEVKQRIEIEKSLGAMSLGTIEIEPSQRGAFLEHLRKAVYVSILACFVQGMATLARADVREAWNLDLKGVARIWRAGCIIKSDYITDLLERHYEKHPAIHPLCGEEISSDIKKCISSLQMIVLKGIEMGARVPCLGATLEYLKYIGSTNLPTSFTEAQLDSFGAHGFDLKSEPVTELTKGTSRA